ncbi:MAG: AI-2E family transporter [Acidimicrobiia bacterium]
MRRERGSGIRRVGVVAWSLLGTIFLIATLIWLVTRVWIIVPLIVFAIAIIYVLNPIVNLLARRGVARWLGSCLSYAVLAGLLTLIGFLVIPSIADQAAELADDFPRIYDEIVADIESLAAGLGLDNVDLPDYDRLEDEFAEDGFFREHLGRITEVTLGVLETILLLTLAPVIAFYVLLDLPTVRRKTLELIPPNHRAEISFVGRDLGAAVGGFLRGQLLVALIVGVMTSFGFWLVGLPFWLLIGMIAGFLNIIPFVGPWVGGILGVMVALATTDFQTALWAGLVALIVQQVDNHFISPTVLRATVRIHPAVIVLGLIAAASIGGFWGVLLAVPVMAAVKIIVGHYWRTRMLGESWEEAREAVIDDDPVPDTFITRLLDGDDDPPES